MIKKFADWLLKTLCRPEYYSDIRGDLEELNEKGFQNKSEPSRDLHYLKEVILLLRPSIVRSAGLYKLLDTTLLLNDIKVAYRHMVRNRVHAGINIVGFALGISSCMLIFFYVNHELSYDGFHVDGHKIHRITTKILRGDQLTYFNDAPPAMGPALMEGFPEIEHVTRIRFTEKSLFTYQDKYFYENNGWFADSAFLRVFSFPLIQGNRQTALSRPNTIVLTESLATKYFGEADPMGKSIDRGGQLLEVTGVLAEVPSNSHIDFDFLVSFDTYHPDVSLVGGMNSWRSFFIHTYVVVSENVSIENLEKRIEGLYHENIPNIGTDLKIEVYAQPLNDIYFGSNEMVYVLDNQYRGNLQSIHVLIAVGILIVVIAGFNYTNLLSASIINRSKEIGIRKSLGALRFRLVSQLLMEAVIIALIALTLALFLLLLLGGVFSQKLGLNLHYELYDVLYSVPYVFFTSITIAVLAALYPSITSTRLDSSLALKGVIKSAGSGKWTRNGLMTFQFCISVGLIAAALIVVRQTNYLKTLGLGIESERVLVLDISQEGFNEHYNLLRDVLNEKPSVVGISYSDYIPRGNNEPSVNSISRTDAPDNRVAVATIQVGYDYANTVGLEVAEGRFFSPQYHNDSLGAVVINKSAAKKLGLEHPIGARVTFVGGINRTIIGVVDDFNYASLRRKIDPMALVMPNYIPQNLLIKLAAGPLNERIEDLERTWNETAPGLPFDFIFLDDRLDRMYEQEEKLGGLITGFSGLAVFLACLGLYGLVKFTMNHKLKEIGIRKVLGASVARIIALVTRQFIWMIIIANLVAWPLTWHLGETWLKGFAYRIEISWWTFAFSGLVLVTVCMTTIGYQSIKAAMTNPVNVLRDE